MASSPSKSLHVPCNSLYHLILVIFISLLLASCTATRPGVMVTVERKTSMNSEYMKPLPVKHEKGFQYHGQVFSFFPKGTPVPPSGPSKRHNSVVDSKHN
ncbi:protein ida [Fagus crenata]